MVDKSVEDGDIDDRIKVETIRQKIRDEVIADATRYYRVDWPLHLATKACGLEIGSV